MTAPDIDGLVERLAALSGPDRESDAKIYTLAIGLKMYQSVYERPDGDLCIHEYADPTGPSYFRLLRFTESIDAALTLVPEGWCWGLFDEPNAWLWPTPTRDLLTGIQGKGATPAIALCIASLRARQK